MRFFFACFKCLTFKIIHFSIWAMCMHKEAAWDVPTIEMNYQNWCSTLQENISPQIGLNGHVELFLFQFPFQGFGIPLLSWFRSFQLVKAAIGLLTLHWEGEKRDCDCVLCEWPYVRIFIFCWEDEKKDVTTERKISQSQIGCQWIFFFKKTTRWN